MQSYHAQNSGCNTRLRSFENACVRAEKNRSVLRIVGKQTGDCSSRTSPTKILPSSENVIMDHSNNLNTTILFQKVPPDDIVFVNDFCLNCHRCIFRQAAPKWLTSWRCAAVKRATGDPLHSRAACTQPCNVNTQSRAHCSPGARLCEQWQNGGHGCVNNRARLCASARLCRGSPVVPSTVWIVSICVMITRNILAHIYLSHNFVVVNNRPSYLTFYEQIRQTNNRNLTVLCRFYTMEKGRPIQWWISAIQLNCMLGIKTSCLNL